MSFIASCLDKLFGTRKGTFSCPCGAVQLQLRVPGSSYCLVEQTNAICHCHDCMNFAKACPNGQVVITNHSTHMVQFYKSDVTVAKGRDKIRAVKLTEKAPLLRCYCSECGTPLGADISIGPVMLLYSKFIQGTPSMPLYLPQLVVNFASAPEETTRPYDKHTTVRKGLLAPLFFFRVIGRVILGFLLNKLQGGFLENQYEDVPVGLDAIAQKKTK